MSAQIKWISAIIATGFAVPAFAVELPRPPSNWNSCYVGGAAGGVVWGKGEGPNTTIGGPIKGEPRGFIGEAHAGCDYHAPSNWLVGVQGGFEWANVRFRQTAVTPLLGSETLDLKTDQMASLTARLGYVFGPLLLYARGGGVWVNSTLRDFGNNSGAPFGFSRDSSRAIWTWSGGAEYVFAPNWSASLEYTYYNFGNPSFHAPDGSGASSLPVWQNFSVVKFGLNYRFATMQ